MTSPTFTIASGHHLCENTLRWHDAIADLLKNRAAGNRHSLPIWVTLIRTVPPTLSHGPDGGEGRLRPSVVRSRRNLRVYLDAHFLDLFDTFLSKETHLPVPRSGMGVPAEAGAFAQKTSPYIVFLSPFLLLMFTETSYRSWFFRVLPSEYNMVT